MSAAGRALSKALDKPDDWFAPDRFCIKHRPSGLVFWVVNGGFHFDGDRIEGTPHCLGLLERHWLHFKARKIILRTKAAKKAETQAKICAQFSAGLK